MTNWSRRDFLKLTSTLAMSGYLSSLIPSTREDGQKKILLLLFDTMSARHLSLYGYPRETTPELSRFAEHATVYHSHYSGANFTSPATASMFMGMYPWKHRAQNQAGLVRRDLVQQNLFALFGKDFYRFSFAQTEWAHILMNQFADGLERNLPPGAFSVNGSHFFTTGLPREQLLTSFSPGTLIDQYFSLARQLRIGDSYRETFPEYPKGIPVISDNNVAFRLEDVFNGVFAEVQNACARPLPHFSYYHLYAPHSPFRPTRDFMHLFDDKYKPLPKPDHPLSSHETYRGLVADAKRYDQYIANVDHEFGLLMKRLENDGLLQDTYILVTSDHGELFERSTNGHAGPLMFDSVIHIPLLIRAPGQSTRTDIHTPTSNVDLLPTLLSLFGKKIPPNVDGKLLPGFGGSEDYDRVLYSMFSPRSSAFGLLREGTFVLQQGQYKLIYYKGYKKYPEAFELYNIQDDPHEIQDLMTQASQISKQMKEQLLHALRIADEPYK